jgi:hypothetical protein
MSGQKTVLAPQLGNLLAQQNNWIDQTAHLIQLAVDPTLVSIQQVRLVSYCTVRLQAPCIQLPGSGYILDLAS